MWQEYFPFDSIKDIKIQIEKKQTWLSHIKKRNNKTILRFEVCFRLRADKS